MITLIIVPDNAHLIEGVGNSSFLGINSPVSGVVLSINQESETVVAAGALLMEIGDPENIEVIVDVLSNVAVQISRVQYRDGRSLSSLVLTQHTVRQIRPCSRQGRTGQKFSSIDHHSVDYHPRFPQELPATLLAISKPAMRKFTQI